MRNHFHLLVRIKSEEEIGITFEKTLRRPILKPDGERPEKSPQAGLPSKKFSDFFNAYAKAINKAYSRSGSLFQHPFSRVAVKNDRQFWNVIAYIHQNPQKHKIVDDFRDWKYSSYGLLLTDDNTFLQRDVVLEWFGGERQYLDLHESWVTENQSKWFAEEDD